MDKVWNYLRGLFNMVTEVDRLRTDVRVLQDKDHKRDLTEREIIAIIRDLTQRLEHKEQLHAVETRALKAIPLRFERRLPSGD